MRKPNYKACERAEVTIILPCDVRKTSRGVQLIAVGKVDREERGRGDQDQLSTLEGIIKRKDQQTRGRLRGILGEVEK